MKENYIVSARKYRPTSFSTVVGQQALTHTLKTAIQDQKLAHAYLFCGPRGVGKTTCARIFAKAINCEHLTADGEPCNECESCQAFNEQRSLNIVELDAASNNSVDDIRAITDQVRIPPQVGRYRVFIIDEVHMLSTAAFNAFLKTLEEPPEYAIFILATTEKQKIIPTILSRCQIYDFNRIKVPDIVHQLEFICQDRGVTAEPAALNVIAQKADGAMRDALSIFDQVSASCEGHITYQATLENLNVLDYDYYFRLDDAFLRGDVPGALLIYKDIRDHGFDSQFFINGLAQHLRDLMVASTPQTAKLLEMNDDVAQRYVLEAAKFGAGYYYRAMDLCNQCDLNYRNASNKQFLVELTLIKLCQLLVPTPLPPGGGEKPAGIKKIAPAAPAAPQPAPAAPAPAPQQPAAPAPAPAPQPAAPAPAPAPAAPAHLALERLKRLKSSINSAPVAQPEQPVAQSQPQTLARQTVFTDEQLLAAWQAYIDRHPHEVLVINTMRTSLPKRLDKENFEMVVPSEGQLQFMTGSMPEILKFLRDAVANDMVSLKIRVDKTRPQTAVSMTDREVVKDIISRHPEMDKMIQDFGLKLV